MGALVVRWNMPLNTDDDTGSLVLLQRSTIDASVEVTVGQSRELDMRVIRTHRVGLLHGAGETAGKLRWC